MLMCKNNSASQHVLKYTNLIKRRARKLNTRLSKRRVKIEHDSEEMEIYKGIGRFGGTHAGSCLFAWS